MTNAKSTKRALLASVLSMMLCCAMLIGTTFAWFTDSVTSGTNIIKSGALDVAMEWADGKADIAAAEWKDASQTAIFNYDLWEPGYTEVRHIKISNVGTLALKYEVRISATGEVSKLADVIDVYYIKDGKQIANRTELNDDDKIGTLSQVLANPAVAKGHIDGKNGETVSSDIATIALKMQETAGNDYQGLSIGSEFAVQLVATQYTKESDSFDNQYDKDSEYLIVVNTVDELNNAIGKLQAGDSVTIEMNDNIGLNAKINIPEGVTVALDMKNHKIGHETTEQIGVTPLVNSGNLTVRNAEIYSKDGMLNSTSSATANAALTSLAGNVVLEKCKLTNFSGRAYGSYCVGISGGTVTLNDCIIDGYRGGISLGGDAVLKASNCTVNAQFYYPVYMYGNSTADFMNCTFNKCKVENHLNPNQAGNAGLIFDNRDNDAPIVKFDTCTFNSTWKDGQSVPLEVSGNLTGMIFNDCVFGDNITGLPN